MNTTTNHGGSGLKGWFGTRGSSWERHREKCLSQLEPGIPTHPVSPDPPNLTVCKRARFLEGKIQNPDSKLLPMPILFSKVKVNSENRMWGATFCFDSGKTLSSNDLYIAICKCLKAASNLSITPGNECCSCHSKRPGGKWTHHYQSSGWRPQLSYVSPVGLHSCNQESNKWKRYEVIFFSLFLTHSHSQ